MQKKENVLATLSTYICIFVTSRMQILKNGLTNRKTFLTNIFKNIIWHLFAGESHQDATITATNSIIKAKKSRSLSKYCTSMPGHL
jgi:hypothetical protein